MAESPRGLEARGRRRSASSQRRGDARRGHESARGTRPRARGLAARGLAQLPVADDVETDRRVASRSRGIASMSTRCPLIAVEVADGEQPDLVGGLAHRRHEQIVSTGLGTGLSFVAHGERLDAPRHVMAHGTHDRGSAEEPPGAVGLALRQSSLRKGAPVLGDDQRSAAHGSGDNARNADVELVGVDDVRPPAGHEQTCQDGEDGQRATSVSSLGRATGRTWIRNVRRPSSSASEITKGRVKPAFRRHVTTITSCRRDTASA